METQINQSNIRNFCIISHVDHGKSTLADRMLELTHTVEKRDMKEQMLDQMDLERERGITIKLAPVRMEWTQASRTNADLTPKDADNTTQNGAEETRTIAEGKLLYEDLTYKIRGAVFAVKNKLGLGHKESIYQKALSEELRAAGFIFETEKTISIDYNGKNIGNYRSDFIVEDKIIIELKSLPFIGKTEKTQAWTYLKGSSYKLLLLINFGSSDLTIDRIIYDSARLPRQSASSPHLSAKFILNLIDTPGHVDFSYEVSRSLAAVEGAVLLVDATQGVEAQTLSTLYAALEHDLTIIPVINKVDLPAAKIDETKEEIIHLLGCREEDIILASGKTGQGVEAILEAIINLVPAPKEECEAPLKALIFDSKYDPFRGVVAFVRLFSGKIEKNSDLLLIETKSTSRVEEVGIFSPKLSPLPSLSAGEIGYIVTGFKDVSEAAVGDTITLKNQPATTPLSGYKKVQPYVFASIFSSESDQYGELKEAIKKLKLNDAALSFEPENSDALGFGFRCGFLGLLHLDIVRERLEREFNLDLIITSPTVAYEVILNDEKKIIVEKATDLPNPGQYRKIFEPWVELEIISPKKYLGNIMELTRSKRGIYLNTEYLDTDRLVLKYQMPLNELIIDYYDQIKSVSSGYASLNYELIDYREADLKKVDILIAEDKIDSLSFIVHADKTQTEARRIVGRLKELIPKQNFEIKIQAAVGATIIASERISALRKDVTAKLYGGDVTRKNKLLDKQKKGKKRLRQFGKVNLPSDIFIKALRND